MAEVSDQQPKVTPVRRSAAIRHFVFSAVLWITYVIYWRVVLVRGVEHEARLAGILLLLFLVLQFLLTQTWIAHNRSLARRHATRRQVRPASPPEEPQDFLGRDLQTFPSDSDLKRVPVVVVRVVGGEKRFEAGFPLGDPASAPKGKASPIGDPASPVKETS